MKEVNRRKAVTPSDVIEAVEECTSELILLLQNVADGFSSELVASPEPRFDEAVHTLELASRSRLAQEGPVTGMGFVAAPEQDLPAALKLIWWIKQGEEIRVKKHVLNPASDSYYDYNTSEWFGTARNTGKPFISAPYIDAWGTDQLTITAAVPMEVNNSFLGVMAADLDPGAYLKPVEELLLASDSLTLVDEEDRVILSSIPVLTTGIFLGRYLQRAGIRPQGRESSPSTNWQVVSLP